MITFTIACLSLYLLICLAVLAFQERMIYFPTQALEATPANIGAHYEEQWVTTQDGITLHGWWIPHHHGSFVALFLHGNAGNISHRLQVVETLRELGLSVLLMDYRGYGQSRGRPTEQGTYHDAEAIYRHLTVTRGVNPSRVVIIGRSLGGGIATWLASKNALRRASAGVHLHQHDGDGSTALPLPAEPIFDTCSL